MVRKYRVWISSKPIVSHWTTQLITDARKINQKLLNTKCASVVLLLLCWSTRWFVEHLQSHSIGLRFRRRFWTWLHLERGWQGARGSSISLLLFSGWVAGWGTEAGSSGFRSTSEDKASGRWRRWRTSWNQCCHRESWIWSTIRRCRLEWWRIVRAHGGCRIDSKRRTCSAGCLREGKGGLAC